MTFRPRQPRSWHFDGRIRHFRHCAAIADRCFSLFSWQRPQTEAEMPVRRTAASVAGREAGVWLSGRPSARLGEWFIGLSQRRIPRAAAPSGSFSTLDPSGGDRRAGFRAGQLCARLLGRFAITPPERDEPGGPLGRRFDRDIDRVPCLEQEAQTQALRGQHRDAALDEPRRGRSSGKDPPAQLRQSAAQHDREPQGASG